MKSKKLILEKGIYYSFSIVTGISTIASLLGYSMKELFNNLSLWEEVLVLLMSFILIFCMIILIQFGLNHKGLTIHINGKEISIKKANIFTTHGLKVIPFNEKFDTIVDDIIISHDSLNGIMIDKYIDNVEDLNKTIKDTEVQKVQLSPIKKRNKFIYPLGRIIKYKDYLMLATTHFDNQNQSHIDISEYEMMLTNMWHEIRRVYAGKKIVLPLIGSGITTTTGIKEKDNTMLLKCMLCTLKRSGFQPKNGITIALTQELIDNTEMLKIRGGI